MLHCLIIEIKFVLKVACLNVCVIPDVLMESMVNKSNHGPHIEHRMEIKKTINYAILTASNTNTSGMP